MQKALELEFWFVYDTVQRAISYELARLLPGKDLQFFASELCMDAEFFNEDGGTICSYLYPFLLCNKRVRLLRNEVESKKNAIGLNATTGEFIKWYIVRASGSLSGWVFIPMNSIINPENIEELISNVRKELRERWRPKNEHQLDLKLRNLKKPVIVGIPMSPDQEVIARLREAF